MMLVTIEQEIGVHLNSKDIIDDFKNSTQRRMVL